MESIKPWEEVLKHGLGVTKKQGSSYFHLGTASSGSGVGALLEEGASASGAAESSMVLFSGVVQGFRKDQDRFILLPTLLEQPQVVFSGVFDGHGKDGDIIAECVALKLPEVVRGRLVDILSKQEDGIPEAFRFSKGQIKEALADAFAEVQAKLDADYESQVARPMMQLKEQMEKEQQIELGELELPLGSGTTATAILIHDKVLYVAYVGDSRAVLCSEDPFKDGGIVSEDLSEDQNVSKASPDELERLERAGGAVYGKHVAGDYIDGMLQLTRSLGDVPLHRKGIVLHKPSLRSVPLTSSTLFCLAASDGIWDHFGSLEACQFVHEKVTTLLKSSGAGSSVSPEEVFLKVSKELQNEAAARAANAGHQSDDTSVLIACVKPWW